MSPSHHRMNSQKLYANHLLIPDKIDDEGLVEENRYQKPMKLMQAFSDGHLGTYAPSKNFPFFYCIAFFDIFRKKTLKKP